MIPPDRGHELLLVEQHVRDVEAHHREAIRRLAALRDLRLAVLHDLPRRRKDRRIEDFALRAEIAVEDRAGNASRRRYHDERHVVVADLRKELHRPGGDLKPT